ncbi:DUF7537 family lipoprotein [Halosimplex salinum]|uniref:DUF7537 family lipoprotein n=1 Tax=Halosimplex salinum TaxID=1710538 RepID=UPI000F478E44|nr:hypothetical protein [Halosimplex salinum]
MRAAAVVVVLVVLAGCSGIVPGPDPDSGPETVTPAPVPTDEGFPPGIGPSGVTDSSALAVAHAAALDGNAYTLLSNRTVRRPNGSIRSVLAVELELSPSRRYHVDVSVRGPDAPVVIGEPPTRAEYWADDETYLRRQVIDNRTEYSRYDASEDYVGTWRFWLGTVALDIGPEADLRRTLDSFRTSVAERTTDDGRELVHIVGTATRSDEFVDDQSDAGAVTNATLHAFVTESGFVESYHVVYDAERADGSVVRVRRSVRFREVGSTTVDRPSWYDEAVAQG